MISEPEVSLLSIFFSHIPAHGNLNSYSLNSDTLEDELEQADLVDELDNWRRFFNSSGSGEIELNIEQFISELCETLSDDEWLTSDPEYSVISEDSYIIILPYERGDLKLRVYLDGESIRDFNPTILEKKLCAWTVSPTESVDDQDGVYSWSELVSGDFIEEIGVELKTTFGADSILSNREIPVVPDILANAGGVTVSYFEWLQDINRRSWSRKRVNDELEEEMLAAWNAVRREFEARDCTWRDAAYIVALSRIANAHESRGLWP
jgi:hypothetical protein